MLASKTHSASSRALPKGLSLHSFMVSLEAELSETWRGEQPRGQRRGLRGQVGDGDWEGVNREVENGMGRTRNSRGVWGWLHGDLSGGWKQFGRMAHPTLAGDVVASDECAHLLQE